MLIENVEGITYYELAEIEMKDGTIARGVSWKLTAIKPWYRSLKVPAA